MLQQETKQIAFILAVACGKAFAFSPITPSTPSFSKSSIELSMTTSTKQQFKPNLPLPPPLRSETPGTWAYDTMSRRIDSEILERTFLDNQDKFLNDTKFAAAYQNFLQLRNDLQNAETTPLRHLNPLPPHMETDPVAKLEYDQWYNIMAPLVDAKYIDQPHTWLSAPWLTAEFYLYRRLMEVFDYFNPQSSTFRYDPFLPQKQAGLTSSLATAEPILKQIESLPEKSPKDGLALAAAFALWGNKMDLSIWPADDMENIPGMFQDILKSANDNLLHDDTNVLVQRGEALMKKGGGNVDIVVDNAGFELIMDLALADYLIASGIAKTVTFQLKSHPTFVSDAMEADLRSHVDYYVAADKNESHHCQAAGMRWAEYLESGKWICNEHSFWVQPTPMWDMPMDLRKDMTLRCDLAFIKGDANYRRLLGDLEWDFSALFEDVVGSYFPCNVCALRTLKAEIGCGMLKEKWGKAQATDENWLVNGRFGVVHFGNGFNGE